MANSRALKARVKSAENILQITKSMKMVSASKLRQTQLAMGRLTPMAQGSEKLLRELLPGAGETTNPLLAQRQEVRKVCTVLIIGNRGLCGVYNSALLKYFQEQTARDKRDGFAVVVGRWGQDQIEGSGIEVRRRFAEAGDVPTKAEAEALAAYLKELYVTEQADEIRLIYQRYGSFMGQTPGTRPLLPLRPEPGAAGVGDYIFEPDKNALIDALTELWLQSTLFAALLEARTGEHAARMASMTSAVDNTKELISKLTLSLNHARQAAITTEISEIAGGAAAMENRR